MTNHTEAERAELDRKLKAGEISELDYWIGVTRDEGESFASQSYRNSALAWLKEKHRAEIQETWIPLVNDLRKQLQAAPRTPAAPVPQGWKLVPVEPTVDMCAAGSKLNRAYYCYAAMLEASPQPPEAAPLVDKSPELQGFQVDKAVNLQAQVDSTAYLQDQAAPQETKGSDS